METGPTMRPRASALPTPPTVGSSSSLLSLCEAVSSDGESETCSSVVEVRALRSDWGSTGFSGEVVGVPSKAVGSGATGSRAAGARPMAASLTSSASSRTHKLPQAPALSYDLVADGSADGARDSSSSLSALDVWLDISMAGGVPLLSPSPSTMHEPDSRERALGGASSAISDESTLDGSSLGLEKELAELAGSESEPASAISGSEDMTSFLADRGSSSDVCGGGSTWFGGGLDLGGGESSLSTGTAQSSAAALARASRLEAICSLAAGQRRTPQGFAAVAAPLPELTRAQSTLRDRLVSKPAVRPPRHSVLHESQMPPQARPARATLPSPAPTLSHAPTRAPVQARPRSPPSTESFASRRAVEPVVREPRLASSQLASSQLASSQLASPQPGLVSPSRADTAPAVISGEVARVRLLLARLEAVEQTRSAAARSHALVVQALDDQLARLRQSRARLEGRPS